MEMPYLGAVKVVARTFASRGWLFCEGQTLPISQYETLFNLLGTRYGGDGEVTFRLPDTRDPANPTLHRGFSEEQPLKYAICVEGYFPQRP